MMLMRTGNWAITIRVVLQERSRSSIEYLAESIFYCSFCLKELNTVGRVGLLCIPNTREGLLCVSVPA